MHEYVCTCVFKFLLTFSKLLVYISSVWHTGCKN